MTASSGGGDGRAADLSALLAQLAAAPELDPASAWDRAPRPGDRFGRFELLRELGRGGFGVVFEARDHELSRTVAFKAVRPSLRAAEGQREVLLRREAEAVAQLHHPNIVTLHDVGRCQAGPYLILERLEGETAAARLERGPVPLREALRIATDVARALDHAHRRGVLHRDLKPANVILGGEAGAKVLDFGLAHVLGAGGPSGGTPGHMAPEQRRGGPEDARTDVWALGVLLAELLGSTRAGDDPEGPPRLPPGVPPRVAALVASATAPDPADRPPDAAALLAALLAAERSITPRRWQRRWVASAVVAGALLAAVVGWRLGRREAVGPIRLVAVADVQNDTGEPALDSMSGLLGTSLEQSRRLSVLPRARLRPSGPEAAARIDEAAARGPAARAGATVLLVPVVTHAGGGYQVAVRAVEPSGGRLLFARRLQVEGGPGALAAAVDRLSAEVRDALSESPAEQAGAEVRVASALTADLEAYRWYFLGEQCAALPVLGQDCAALFRKAVASDPGFAAGWYRLAAWSWTWGGDRSGQREDLARAEARAAGAPEKERLLIAALRSSLDGRTDEALETYRRVTTRWPEDPEAWLHGATLLRRRDAFVASLPWLERAVATAPDSAVARGDLVESLAAAGQLDRLRALAATWEREPGLVALHARSLAQGWLGDPAGAERLARHAVALGGGLLAQEDLLLARLQQGAYAEVAAAAAALTDPASQVRPVGFYALAATDAYQGRPRAGLARLDALRAARPALTGDALDLTLRADYAMGLDDPRAARQAVEALAVVSPREAAEHAAGLAWLGERDLAARVAASLQPGSVQDRAWRAVALVRRGEVEPGLAGLRALSDETPASAWRVAPLFLYADLAAEHHHDDAAVDAFRRLDSLYLPRTMWRAWARPRGLLRLAQLEARRGRAAEARAALDLFLAGLVEPERGWSLLAEALALRASLR